MARSGAKDNVMWEWLGQREWQCQVRMARSGGKALSSENGWIRWEGQCRVRKAGSGWKGNVKWEGLGQLGKKMTSENG